MTPQLLGCRFCPHPHPFPSVTSHRFLPAVLGGGRFPDNTADVLPSQHLSLRFRVVSYIGRISLAWDSEGRALFDRRGSFPLPGKLLQENRELLSDCTAVASPSHSPPRRSSSESSPQAGGSPSRAPACAGRCLLWITLLPNGVPGPGPFPRASRPRERCFLAAAFKAYRTLSAVLPQQAVTVSIKTSTLHCE